MQALSGIAAAVQGSPPWLVRWWLMSRERNEKYA
jgi:hypothetical protein